MKPVIAIVAGGDSSEYEVSLRSAAGISAMLHADEFIWYVVEMRGQAWHVVCDGRKIEVDKNDFSFMTEKGKQRFDFAYITIHGTPGEDGILQGYFDLIGLPYSTSGVLVEALTFNKFALNNFLRSDKDLHISDSMLVRKGERFPAGSDVVERLGLPCFVKPNAGGSSFGITKVKSAEEVKEAIEKAMRESDEVMIEGLMTGTEITCGAYRKGDEVIAFPITEVVTEREFFDYDAKYNGEVQEITPARIAETTARRVTETTQKIYKMLDCYGIIRVDYILSGEKGKEVVNLLEINTTPGMTTTSFIPQQVRAAGLDMGDVLSDIIKGKLL